MNKIKTFFKSYLPGKIKSLLNKICNKKPVEKKPEIYQESHIILMKNDNGELKPTMTSSNGTSHLTILPNPGIITITTNGVDKHDEPSKHNEEIKKPKAPKKKPVKNKPKNKPAAKNTKKKKGK